MTSQNGSGNEAERPLYGDVAALLAGEPEEWKERLRLAVEKTLRERERRKAERAEFKRRRDHGLKARHAAKLARKEEGQ